MGDRPKSTSKAQVPVEVITRILALMQVRDLVRLCLVCKEWKNIILFSPYFHELQSQLCPPEKGILCLKNDFTSCSRYFPFPEKEKTSSCGSIGPLNVPGFRICCYDRGLVCICDNIDDDVNIFKVGNPLLNSWKIITSPPQYFDPIAMSVVEKSGNYMILATNLDAPESESDLELESDRPVMAEVFDSRRNCWIRAATLDWDSTPRSGHVWSAVLIYKNCLASYNFDQDCWSMMYYADRYGFESVCIPYNGKAIVVECVDDSMLVRLVSSRCSEFVTLLEHPKLRKMLKGPWTHLLTIGKDETIGIIVDSLSRILVLEYDLVRHSWRLLDVPDFLQVRKSNLKFLNFKEVFEEESAIDKNFILRGVTVLFEPSFLQP